ncbi:hypothetical protein LX32DRAFT_6368 [Colletotrichum zoysiae]|uniref:Uncharacterized protein n=1 Tax=Colletotrichum zoysiae TaxID=1216348 RepID=A0AAD9HTL0_9PEZI|nr:hypothetical protein LX32DRAFT_6368 [Colletotrichum zoysiae]
MQWAPVTSGRKSEVLNDSQSRNITHMQHLGSRYVGRVHGEHMMRFDMTGQDAGRGKERENSAAAGSSAACKQISVQGQALKTGSRVMGGRGARSCPVLATANRNSSMVAGASIRRSEEAWSAMHVAYDARFFPAHAEPVTQIGTGYNLWIHHLDSRRTSFVRWSDAEVLSFHSSSG